MPRLPWRIVTYMRISGRSLIGGREPSQRAKGFPGWDAGKAGWEGELSTALRGCGLAEAERQGHRVARTAWAQA